MEEQNRSTPSIEIGLRNKAHYHGVFVVLSCYHDPHVDPRLIHEFGEQIVETVLQPPVIDFKSFTEG